jgi:hypothetical protein
MRLGFQVVVEVPFRLPTHTLISRFLLELPSHPQDAPWFPGCCGSSTTTTPDRALRHLHPRAPHNLGHRHVLLHLCLLHHIVLCGHNPVNLFLSQLLGTADVLLRQLLFEEDAGDARVGPVVHLRDLTGNIALVMVQVTDPISGLDCKVGLAVALTFALDDPAHWFGHRFMLSSLVAWANN